jgi:hypothetical protein
MYKTFLLRAQEKVTKEKGTPAVMAFGFLRQLSVITGRAYMTSCHERAQLCVLQSCPYNCQLPQHDKGGSNINRH